MNKPAEVSANAPIENPRKVLRLARRFIAAAFVCTALFLGCLDHHSTPWHVAAGVFLSLGALCTIIGTTLRLAVCLSPSSLYRE